MNWYPFDLQTCSMILAMKGKGEDFADLHPDQLQYLGKDEVNQYVVYSYKLQQLPENPSRVKFRIKFICKIPTVPGWGRDSHGKEPPDNHPDHFCPNCPSEHDQLLHKLLQTFLLWSHRDCEPHSHAGPHNLVHQCECHQFDWILTVMTIDLFRWVTACRQPPTSRWSMSTSFSLWWFHLGLCCFKPTWMGSDCKKACLFSIQSRIKNTVGKMMRIKMRESSEVSTTTESQLLSTKMEGDLYKRGCRD